MVQAPSVDASAQQQPAQAFQPPRPPLTGTYICDLLSFHSDVLPLDGRVPDFPETFLWIMCIENSSSQAAKAYNEGSIHRSDGTTLTVQ